MHSGNIIHGANILYKLIQRIKISDMLIPIIKLFLYLLIKLFSY